MQIVYSLNGIDLLPVLFHPALGIKNQKKQPAGKDKRNLKDDLFQILHSNGEPEWENGDSVKTKPKAGVMSFTENMPLVLFMHPSTPYCLWVTLSNANSSCLPHRVLCEPRAFSGIGKMSTHKCARSGVESKLEWTARQPSWGSGPYGSVSITEHPHLKHDKKKIPVGTKLRMQLDWQTACLAACERTSSLALTIPSEEQIVVYKGYLLRFSIPNDRFECFDDDDNDDDDDDDDDDVC
ncbi:hypothetical protein STEG23_019915, partial [Scotinomys teguina]